ncbi:T9SS type A sorting domain-containing protein [candidate division KSB1 bacterium]|nr:T9SS type A sorting domain-containing protein [candidate division KSB1 bacterium]
MKTYSYINFFILLLLSASINVSAQPEQTVPSIPGTDGPVLVQPAARSLLHTKTPEFKWKPLNKKDIEYRLRIAEWNGKIVFDEWVGTNTHFVMPRTDLFDDLKIYLWSVFAYQGQDVWQSDTYSFCVDLDVSVDLEVLQIRQIDPTVNYSAGQLINFEADVLNCGPVQCRDIHVLLSNGNPNINYKITHRQSVEQDSVIIEKLNPNEVVTVHLKGQLRDGLNHFFAQIKTRGNFSDIYLANNVKNGPLLQTYDDRIQLKGLFVFYPATSWVDDQRFILSKEAKDQLFDNIQQLDSFLWEHTHLLTLKIDTVYASSNLVPTDFTLLDEKSGYLLSPAHLDRIKQSQNVNPAMYDFIFTYYPWNNSLKHWVGYHGYVFQESRNSSTDRPLAAQPVAGNITLGFQVTVHEFMHIIESLVPDNSESTWPSPDEMEMNTTFVNELDYYAWMLESWPANRWFDMKSANTTTVYAQPNLVDSDVPGEFMLMQNYPNPFNSSTIIQYRIPDRLNSDQHQVSLKIYSLLGECVKTLVFESQAAGEYAVRWDGTNEENYAVPTGMYFYRLSFYNQNQVRKLLFLK